MSNFNLHCLREPGSPGLGFKFLWMRRGTSLALGAVLGMSLLSSCSGGGWGAVKPNVSITQGSTMTVISGQPITLTAQTTGSGPFTFQWYQNDQPINGANASTYTVSSTSAMNGNTFKVVVTNAAGSSTQSTTVTVNTPPSVTTPPASQTVTAAQAATFSVVASGTAPLSYQWYQNGQPISGATASTYTTPATNALGNFSYTVAVSNVAGTVTSPTAVLAVNPIQPALAFASVPDHTWGDASFGITAGSVSPGAVTYGVVSGPAAMAGNQVILTGIGPVVLQATQQATGLYAAATAQVSFNVNAQTPALVFAPVATHTYGDAPFAVSAASASSGAVTYSVVSGPATIAGNSVSINGTGTVTLKAQQAASGNYAAATATTSFTVNAATPVLSFAPIAAHTFGDASFAVSASSASAGAITYSVTSGPATMVGNQLTLNGAGTVTLSAQQAATANYTAATATASFTVNAATPTLSFTAVGSKMLGVAAFGVTASSVSTGNISYSVQSGPATIIGNQVTLNGVGMVVLKAFQEATGNYNYATATTSFAVTDSTPLASNLTGSTATPAYGASITLTPSFSGGTAVIGTSGQGSSDVTSSAVSGQAYTSAAVTAHTVYTLTVTSLGGGTTATHTFTATPGTVVLGPVTPAAQTMAPGMQTFAVTVSGGSTNTVTWSATGGSIDASGKWTSPDTPGTYTIKATSVDEPSISSSTTATISLPIINTQPVSKNVCSGYDASLTVDASYATNYTWMENGSQVGTGATLTLPSVTTAANGTYVAVVSNGAGNVTTNSSLLNVLAPTTLTITSDPANVTVYATQTATFAVSATGTGTLHYQWYQNGAAISGATSSTYTTPALTAGDDGSTFYVTVTDVDCTNTTRTSATATLSVSTTDTAVPPTIVTQPLGVTASVNGTATFTVVASGPGPLKYQWYRVPYNSANMSTVAGTSISGATSASYAVPTSATYAANDGDQYYVTVANDYGSAVSQRAVLAVGKGMLLQVTGQPQSEYVAVNSLATFSVTATCINCTAAYKWYLYSPKSTTPTLLSDGAVSSGALNGATISGSSKSTLTINSVPSTASGSVLYAVVTSTSDGTTLNAGTNPVSTNTAGLFVGSLGTVGAASAGHGLCNDSVSSVNWVLNGTTNSSPTAGTISGDVPYQNTAGCTIQMTDDQGQESAAVYWPTLISTAKFTVSFTVAMAHAGFSTPADGFTMILADPSQGATTSSLGRQGEGMGAAEVPGLVVGFDTYQNGNSSNGSISCSDDSNTDNSTCDPISVPYMAVGQGTANLWANPWTNVNGNLDTQNSSDFTALDFSKATHNYVISVVSGTMTVTMDGYELFTGKVNLPPVAYLGFTASTGGSTESVTLSNLTATVSAP